MSLFYPPQPHETDSNGDPLTGGKLYFYEPGTTTLKTTYQDKALTTAHANPVVADAAGRWDPIYTDGSYKVKLTDTNDVEIWTEDNVSFGASGDFFAETQAITANTAIDSTYERDHLRCTNTITLTLLAIATAGQGFMFSVINDGTGTVTIDPNASEQINDTTSIVLPPGASGIVVAGTDEWSYIGIYTDAVTPLSIDSTVNAIGAIGGGTQDIDLESGRTITATVDTSETTFTFSNPKASGKADAFDVFLTNGGSQTVNWPASVGWEEDNSPTLTAAGVDHLVFVTTDGGTTWYGYVAGLDV